MATVAGWERFVSVSLPTVPMVPDGTVLARPAYLGHAGQGVTGLIHGDTRQFLCQLMGATLCAAWAFGATYAVFGVVNKVKSMRVSPEAEVEGLDVPEFGLKSYPEDAAVTMEA